MIRFVRFFTVFLLAAVLSPSLVLFFGGGKACSQEGEWFHEIKVPADAGWTDTGLDIEEGREVYFTAEGTISLQKGNPSSYCGPKGYDLSTLQQPLLDENIGALIGKVVHLVSVFIDKETGKEMREEIIRIFYVGAENRVQMPISGRLYLGINENVVADNSGEYTVKYIIFR